MFLRNKVVLIEHSPGFIIDRADSCLPQLRTLRNVFLIFPDMLSYSEEAVLAMGFVYVIVSSLDIAYAVESIHSKLSQTLGI
jgi:hypothetical protein